MIQAGEEPYQEEAGVRGAWGRLCAVTVLDLWAQVCVVGSQVVMGGGKKEVGAREPVAAGPGPSEAAVGSHSVLCHRASPLTLV